MPTRKHNRYLHTYKLENESTVRYSKGEQIFFRLLLYHWLHESEICIAVSVWIRLLL